MRSVRAFHQGDRRPSEHQRQDRRGSQELNIPEVEDQQFRGTDKLGPEQVMMIQR